MLKKLSYDTRVNDPVVITRINEIIKAVNELIAMDNYRSANP